MVCVGEEKNEIPPRHVCEKIFEALRCVGFDIARVIEPSTPLECRDIEEHLRHSRDHSIVAAGLTGAAAHVVRGHQPAAEMAL